MPEPMTAPIPSEVRLNQPSDFLSLISALSESANNWSMLLQRNSGDATHALRSSTRCGNDSASLYREFRPRATKVLESAVLLPEYRPTLGGIAIPLTSVYVFAERPLLSWLNWRGRLPRHPDVGGQFEA